MISFAKLEAHETTKVDDADLRLSEADRKALQQEEKEDSKNATGTSKQLASPPA